MKREFQYFKQFNGWNIFLYLIGLKNRFVEESESTDLRGCFYVEYLRGTRDGKERKIVASGRELTSQGVRFAADMTPKENVLDLKLVFPGQGENGEKQQSITLKSRVRKKVLPPGRTRFRVGCEFVAVASQQRKILESFVQAA